MNAKKLLFAVVAALALSSAVAHDTRDRCHPERCPPWADCTMFVPCVDPCWIEPGTCCGRHHHWDCVPVQE